MPDETQIDVSSTGGNGESHSSGSDPLDFELSIPEAVLNPLPGETPGQAESRIAKLREQITEARRTAVNRAKQIPTQAVGAIEASRESRLATEAKNKQGRSRVKRFLNSKVGKLVRTGAEMIPFPIIWWGPGDFLTGYEAWRGKDVAGNKLDKVDRTIHVIAAGFPLVPATPIVELAHKVRPFIENVVHHFNKGPKPPTPGAH